MTEDRGDTPRLCNDTLTVYPGPDSGLSWVWYVLMVTNPGDSSCRTLCLVETC
jgi:hypothetical protein